MWMSGTLERVMSAMRTELRWETLPIMIFCGASNLHGVGANWTYGQWRTEQLMYLVNESGLPNREQQKFNTVTNYQFHHTQLEEYVA